MKGMDGFELADTLRRLPQYAELPVIMLSARSQVQHRTEAADGDKNVLLTKPFSPIELTAHVNRLLKL
jgi:DNA-binding response OmpR family regulator